MSTLVDSVEKDFEIGMEKTSSNNKRRGMDINQVFPSNGNVNICVYNLELRGSHESEAPEKFPNHSEPVFCKPQLISGKDA